MEGKKVNNSNKCCGLWTEPMFPSVDKAPSTHRHVRTTHTLHACRLGSWKNPTFFNT